MRIVIMENYDKMSAFTARHFAFNEPGSSLQLHPRGMIVCDDKATLELKAGTVKYIKDIERDVIASIN